MAYKFGLGSASLSGSMTTDDIMFVEDTDTGINFASDTIKLETDGTARLEVSNSGLKALTNIVVDTNSEPAIEFKEGGASRAQISVNDSDNLVIHNQTINKHIVLKCNDAGQTREGIRLDGSVPEVVVNQQSDSLVDFRVESDNNTHMLFVDGGNDKVGINTSQPDYALHVAGDIGVDEHIYHNGDADTFVQFANDKIILKSGGRAMITAEINNVQPHEVTINDGSNNVDFVVKGNGSGAGNPGMKFDASTNRLGINGVGSPEVALDVGSDAIRIRNSSTPSSASDFGFPGEIRWDANYIYVCVATDTWKRVALSTW